MKLTDEQLVIIEELKEYCLKAKIESRRCCSDCERSWQKRVDVLNEIICVKPGQCVDMFSLPKKREVDLATLEVLIKLIRRSLYE